VGSGSASPDDANSVAVKTCVSNPDPVLIRIQLSLWIWIRTQADKNDSTKKRKVTKIMFASVWKTEGGTSIAWKSL